MKTMLLQFWVQGFNITQFLIFYSIAKKQDFSEHEKDFDNFPIKCLLIRTLNFFVCFDLPPLEVLQFYKKLG